MTYTPKTSADQVVGGWADFDNYPNKHEIYMRQLKADGIVEPKLVVTDLALEEIPNGTTVRAMFGNRKESYTLKNGQWEEGGFRKNKSSDWIIQYILKNERAGEWKLEIPANEWYRFQK